MLTIDVESAGAPTGAVHGAWLSGDAVAGGADDVARWVAFLADETQQERPRSGVAIIIRREHEAA